jgi:UDP-3-O-[3-hydroxymyristoyl] glucosamine N-acyltransferase
MSIVREPDLLALLREGKNFKHLGLVDSAIPGTVTYIDQEKYSSAICKNENIAAVILRTDLVRCFNTDANRLRLFIADDPRACFYQTHNELAKEKNASLPPTVIDSTSQIHSSAYISDVGVTIGANVRIEPMVTLLPGVEIGQNSIVRSGAKIGVEGFEHTRTSQGILSVIHDGKVLIGERVEIGANNTIARGLMGKNTVIGNDTKTDCLVHIAHCAHVGERCLLTASVTIAGSVIMGDDVWIGPNSSISSQVQIGDSAFVTIGAVVVKTVRPHHQVTGNFAIDHSQFMFNMARSNQKKDSR